MGAPRIHSELLQFGFQISEPTVSRYLQRLKRRTGGEKAKRWLAFLHDHREVMGAFDFFTVPTLTFQVLYCLFVIEHHLRRILHFQYRGATNRGLDRTAIAGGAAIALPARISNAPRHTVAAGVGRASAQAGSRNPLIADRCSVLKKNDPTPRSSSALSGERIETHPISEGVLLDSELSFQFLRQELPD